MSDHLTKKNKKSTLVWVGVSSIILAVVLAVFFLTQGSMTTIESGSVDVVRSLTCESSDVIYSFYESDGADKRFLKINAVLNDDELDTISLTYKLYYPNSEVVEQRTTNMSITMSKSFAMDGLGADPLNVTYASFSDAVQMRLYAGAETLNSVSAKYFLLDGLNKYNKDEIVKTYNVKGLNCVVKE